MWRDQVLPRLHARGLGVDRAAGPCASPASANQPWWTWWARRSSRRPIRELATYARADSVDLRVSATGDGQHDRRVPRRSRPSRPSALASTRSSTRETRTTGPPPSARASAGDAWRPWRWARGATWGGSWAAHLPRPGRGPRPRGRRRKTSTRSPSPDRHAWAAGPRSASRSSPSSRARTWPARSDSTSRVVRRAPATSSSGPATSAVAARRTLGRRSCGGILVRLIRADRSGRPDAAGRPAESWECDRVGRGLDLIQAGWPDRNGGPAAGTWANGLTAGHAPTPASRARGHGVPGCPDSLAAARSHRGWRWADLDRPHVGRAPPEFRSGRRDGRPGLFEPPGSWIWPTLGIEVRCKATGIPNWARTGTIWSGSERWQGPNAWPASDRLARRDWPSTRWPAPDRLARRVPDPPLRLARRHRLTVIRSPGPPPRGPVCSPAAKVRRWSGRGRPGRRGRSCAPPPGGPPRA